MSTAMNVSMSECPDAQMNEQMNERMNLGNKDEEVGLGKQTWGSQFVNLLS